MFSIGKIGGSAAGMAKYYTTGDYYTKGAEEPGVWGGQGAERLGLDGVTVEQQELVDKLDGKLGPTEPTSWNQDKPAESRNKGFDFTFSAPKSVSIMALVGGDERLIDAVKTANAEAMDYAEKYAAVRERHQDGSVTTRQTGNLLYGSFLEKASRALDPHLHVHNPVMNHSFDEERGKWYAVDASHLLKLAKTIDRIATASLARQVQELGYKIVADRGTGHFEIAGILRETIEGFSTRKAEIDKVSEEKGYETAAERASAWAQTRGSKETLKDGEFEGILREAMFDMVEEKQIVQSPLDLDLLRDKAESQRYRPSERDAEKATDYGLRSALSSEAVVEEREVLEAALTGGMGRVTLPEILAAMDRMEEKGQLLRPERATAGKAQLWSVTTRDTLRQEVDYAREVRRGAHTMRAVHKVAEAEKRLDAFRIETKNGPASLSPEQKAAARMVLTTEDRFAVIQGTAGAGKSEMVGAIMQAAPRRQHLGIAPTGKALKELAGKTGIPTQTVQSVIARGGEGINRGAIVYADEASMNDTAQALSLARIARQRGFRLVTIGDRQQLPAIGAGRPHEESVRYGTSVAVLQTSMRHRAGSQAEAVVNVVKAGQAWQDAKLVPVSERTEPVGESPWRGLKEALGDGLKEVEGVGPDRALEDVRGEVVANAAQAWLADPDEEKAAVLAPANQTRGLLNAAIRTELFKSGKLDEKAAVSAITLTPKPMNAAQRQNAYSYAKGDVVVFHKRQERYGIGRGDRFEVMKRGDNDTLTLRPIDRRGDDKVVALATNCSGIAAYEANEQTIAPGDRIAVVSQMKDMKNGDQGRVEKIEGRTAHLAFENGEKHEIDLDRDQHWSHGYAVTMHKAQGATMNVARMVLLGRDKNMMHAKAANNLFTRARHTVEVHTDSFSSVRNRFAEVTGQKTSAIEATIGDRPGVDRAGPPNGMATSRTQSEDTIAIMNALANGGKIAKTPQGQKLFQEAEALRRSLTNGAGSVIETGRALAEKLEAAMKAEGMLKTGEKHELTEKQKEQRSEERAGLARKEEEKATALQAETPEKDEQKAAKEAAAKEVEKQASRDRGGEMEM